MDSYRSSINHYCIVILYILCQFSVTSGYARTTVASCTTTTKSDSDDEYSFRTEGRLITLKSVGDGTPEERYECTLYSRCVRSFFPGQNVFRYYRCNYYGVFCCKMENFVRTNWPPVTMTGFTGTQPNRSECQWYTSILQFLTTSLNPSRDPENAAHLNPIEPTPSTSTTSIDDDCQCVSVDRCRRTESGEVDDSHVWRSRFYSSRTKCWMLDICCPKQNIVTATGSTGKPTPTVTVTPSNTDPACSSEQNVVTSAPTRSTEKPTSTVKTVILSDADPASECGMRNKAKGSNSMSSGEFPWMALLLSAENVTVGKQRLNDVKCGASLISLSILVTAGHCVHDVTDVTSLKVRVGEYGTRPQTGQKRNPHQDRQVLKITVHPEFDSKTLHNDLALIKVTEPFELGYDVNRICIPLTLSTYDYDPNNCVYTGWGKNSFGPLNSQYSTALKKIGLKIVPNDRCQEELRKTRFDQNFKLHSSFICAGGQAGKDTCANGGGGALACPLRSNPDQYVQVGIVSRGFDCGNDTHPAVFASLERNLDWFSQEYYDNTIFS